MTQNFRNLEVWKKAHSFAIDVRKELYSKFPAEEKYALWSQLWRASYSVPMNIAEGCGSNSDKEFRQFLNIALRSARETEYTLLLTKDVEYIDQDKYDKFQYRIVEIQKMLSSFIKKIGGDLNASKQQSKKQGVSS